MPQDKTVVETDSLKAEYNRLDKARAGVPWAKWGPYLSERQWGTVREDYSQNGDAWNYFTHDQARSRIYRWGEGGIAGVSDDQQILCFSLGLWNGEDADFDVVDAHLRLGNVLEPQAALFAAFY